MWNLWCISKCRSTYTCLKKLIAEGKGEGVYAVSNWLAKTGHKVKTKVYPERRHEIHNYRDISDEIENGMIDFINDIIEK
ncbi:alpha-beta hydrolase superfamily lysophospholipase [Clostridium tetanomorphum]|uniref:hypothetical protein n=1 Tax=Clostridium tetanomorphum TaxID=1553 RepID=UPI0030B817E6|nr:alpha-beta hydrolase superfamily lysophospholipase [Clostridium tetanomorphum]NRS83894.1 alpha-beta hydrolase superfamily lysophospholipase [Clostridium tetanomorphum]